MKSRYRFRRGHSDNRKALLICLLVLLPMGAGLAYLFTRPIDKQVVDSAVFVLIDGSDGFTKSQGFDLQTMMSRTVEGLRSNERLEVFTIEENPPSLPVPIFNEPTPPRRAGDDINGNTDTFLERRFDETIRGPIESLVQRLQQPRPARQSPILEYLKGIASRPEFTDPVLKERRIVIFSDMVQNTTGKPLAGSSSVPIEAFRKTAYYREILPDLRGAAMEIYYVRRTAEAKTQGDRHKAFWRAFMADAGAVLPEVGGIVDIQENLPKAIPVINPKKTRRK